MFSTKKINKNKKAKKKKRKETQEREKKNQNNKKVKKRKEDEKKTKETKEREKINQNNRLRYIFLIFFLLKLHLHFIFCWILQYEIIRMANFKKKTNTCSQNNY